jgi:5-oxoprolinase (ATP-hydrolysing) subunit A
VAYRRCVQVDLNADLGEGFGIWRLGDDEALLKIVTSANVACGFHAGDPTTMRRVCAHAAERGVAIGAQVSYRDLAGFGRRRMDVEPAELAADVLYQIGALDAFAHVAGDRVRYVKPHGALYHVVADDLRQADALAQAVADYDRELLLLGLPGSAVQRAAEEHAVGFVGEAFADRSYRADGRLVPRGEPDAVLHDPGAVATRAVEMVRSGTIRTVDGSSVRVRARSVCLHGDTPGAVDLARRVRAALEAAGITVASFAR